MYSCEYSAEMKNGKANGRGELHSVGKEFSYVGEWKNDEFHGHGTFTLPNSASYVGEWKNDKRHGHGTKTNADGSALRW
jgi:hypothetical protein